MPKKYYRLVRNAEAIRQLALAKPKIQKQLLSRPNRDLVLAIVDAARLILAGDEDVHLTKHQFRCLEKHEIPLRDLVSRHLDIGTKQKIIQKGGFIGLILKPLLNTFLPALLGK